MQRIETAHSAPVQSTLQPRNAKPRSAISRLIHAPDSVCYQQSQWQIIDDTQGTLLLPAVHTALCRKACIIKQQHACIIKQQHTKHQQADLLAAVLWQHDSMPLAKLRPNVLAALCSIC